MKSSIKKYIIIRWGFFFEVERCTSAETCKIFRTGWSAANIWFFKLPICKQLPLRGLKLDFQFIARYLNVILTLIRNFCVLCYLSEEIYDCAINNFRSSVNSDRQVYLKILKVEWNNVLITGWRINNIQEYVYVMWLLQAQWPMYLDEKVSPTMNTSSG